MTTFESAVEVTELEQLSWEFSDFYKSVHGFRPRHINTTGWTVEDFDREFTTLSEQGRINAVRQKESEAKAAHDFELRVQNLLMSGAKDRRMAIRWLAEAEDAVNDQSYFCFVLGLPDNYFAGDFI